MKTIHAGKTLIVTSDGSHSISSIDTGLLYHSKHGAIQESRHVFIEAGLQFKAEEAKPLAILEIGFGTGLNALLTFIEADKQQQKVIYSTYELFPIDSLLANLLNYPALLQLDPSNSSFSILHNCDWGKKNVLSNHFTFFKFQQSFLEIKDKEKYDLIYFDPFAPEAQPELWEKSFLQKMFDALLPGGVLTTYCAKGVVKRSLQAVGFRVEKLPGPPGKREMTRAHKNGSI